MHTSSTNRSLSYKRILIKISGQALAGDYPFGIHPKVIDHYAFEIAELINMNVQVGIVVGGGNFFRGSQLADAGMERITADQIGMLGTIMNCLALRDAFERIKLPSIVMSAIPMFGVCDYYDRRKALDALNQHKIVLFAGGTGNPLVTTDTCASLRAIETRCEVLIKATHVDGVYDANPSLDPSAQLLKHITFNEAIEKKYAVMDLAAFCQCQEHNLPIIVCNIHHPNTLKKIIVGELIGTQVTTMKD
jgi:uridylate kinase